jgi:hypothetical protein
MQWDDVVPDRSGLLPGADAVIVQSVEAELGMRLPQEFVDFLLWADGGQIAQRRFIVYSAGAGIHPSETLLAANRGRDAGFPLILVGREAEEEFGFKKSDLPSRSAPVYFYRHDEDGLDKVAGSFREFVEWMFKQPRR